MVLAPGSSDLVKRWVTAAVALTLHDKATCHVVIVLVLFFICSALCSIQGIAVTSKENICKLHTGICCAASEPDWT